MFPSHNRCTFHFLLPLPGTHFPQLATFKHCSNVCVSERSPLLASYRIDPILTPSFLYPLSYLILFDDTYHHLTLRILLFCTRKKALWGQGLLSTAITLVLRTMPDT